MELIASFEENQYSITLTLPKEVILKNVVVLVTPLDNLSDTGYALKFVSEDNISSKRLEVHRSNSKNKAEIEIITFEGKPPFVIHNGFHVERILNKLKKNTEG